MNNYYKKWMLIILGAMFGSGVPLYSLGPSFITWPSTSEIAYFILLAYMLLNKKNNIFPAAVIINNVALWVYSLCITVFGAIIYSSNIIYPSWSFCRFTQWLVIIPILIYTKDTFLIRQLSLGLVVAGLINSAVMFFDIMNYSVLSYLLNNINIDQAGPWASRLDADPMIHGASSLFSFSRTANGFFVSLSAIASVFVFRKNHFKLILVLAILMIGVFMSQSRLGFITFSIPIIYYLLNINAMSSVISRAALIVCFITLSVGVFLISSNFDSRVFNFGEGGYYSGINDRFERQSQLFELSDLTFFFGVGLGNLGAALDTYNRSIHGLHGFLNQYIANIGILGLILFSPLLLKFAGTVKTTFKSFPIFLPLLFAMTSEDFFFPTAEGMHIPIIYSVIFRLFVMTNDDEYKKDG